MVIDHVVMKLLLGHPWLPVTVDGDAKQGLIRARACHGVAGIWQLRYFNNLFHDPKEG
jgi:hypothetical protein